MSYADELGAHYAAVRSRLHPKVEPVPVKRETVKAIEVTPPKPDEPGLPPINYPRDVIPYICVKYRVTPQLLKGDARNKAASKVRWEAYKILNEQFGFSPSRIAHMFHKDHTSVLYGLKKLAQREASK